MRKLGHNGWTNYETWRINLEMIDDIDTDYWTDLIEDNRGSDMLVYNLGQEIKGYVEERLESNNENATSYALAFINQVNWREIAGHVLDTYKENYWCDTCGERFDERYMSSYCSSECAEEYELLATHPKG